MLRSRDTSKYAHQQNGTIMNEPSHSSSFTKYGILVCILFTVIVGYFVFFDNPSTSPISSKSNLSTSPVGSTSGFIPRSMNTPPGSVEQFKPFRLPDPGSIPEARKLTKMIGHQTKRMQPKVLGDLNPLENDKLQRLINSQNGIFPKGKNPLNIFHKNKLGPLDALNKNPGMMCCIYLHSFILAQLHNI